MRLGPRDLRRLRTPEGSSLPPRTPQPAAITRCALATAEAEEPPPPAETQQNYCRPLVKRQSELAEKALLDSYKRRFAPSRVIVDFACDTVQRLNAIDLEFGDQKTHRLALLHFGRVDEDGHYEVWGIDVRAPEDQPRAYEYRSAEHFAVNAARLQLAASALDVEAIRTRPVTTVHEVQFSDGTPSAFGFEEAGSIHRLVLLSGENSEHVYDAAGLIQHEMLVSPPGSSGVTRARPRRTRSTSTYPWSSHPSSCSRRFPPRRSSRARPKSTGG